MEPLGDGDPRRIGAYRLLGRLGAGGMGRVYLARSERGRTVAVKVVQEELARQPAFRERFAKEVAAARRVGGEWTAPVLDADTEAGTPWVATGYIAGPSLQTVVDEDYGPLPEDSVFALAAGLVEALRAIHGAGLVHRDLKPSNVLVTIDGPKVIDFGIARALDPFADSGLTQTGAVIGSPGFMSPEQVRGERVGPAGDVFCLGSVLAYAATGRTPFGTADSGFHALLFRIAQEEPDLSGLRGPLRDLVGSCLAKDPAARPSLDELADRIRERAPRGGTWLPGEVLAQLGRHAVQLLDSEEPVVASVGTHPPTAPLQDLPSAPPPAAFGAPFTGPVAAPQAAPPLHAYPTAPVTGPYAQPGQQGQSWHSTPPPPVTAPYAAAGTGQAGAETVRSVRKLSRLLCLALFVMLAFAVCDVVVRLQIFGELNDLSEGRVSYFAVDYGWLETKTDLMAVLRTLLLSVTAVLWLVWFWRVRANAEAIAPGRIRFHRVWAVLCWLVPVVSLFMPKQIVNDVCDNSDPAATRVGPYGHRLSGNRGLLNGWWALWLITMVTTGLISGHSWYDEPTIDDQAGFAALWFLQAIPALPATILAVLVVTRLTALQEYHVARRD
ncbi:hypothetical protein GCM10010420_38800 [Streptomyces glaucosporus]|uniref:Protein kinase domain-containing protein n=1 Tax=Streptomyces glaucosporus TaxID=284044 RepID=A0ABP5VRJ7_9ACTN